MAVDKKYVEGGEVNYDHLNEDFFLKEARKARDALKNRKDLNHEQRKKLERDMRYNTKEALALRAKQDRKKQPKSAVEAVNKGIKDANIATMTEARRNRIDKESGF